MNEWSKVSELKGVGKKTESLFQKIGLFTLGDLLRYYPRKYDFYEKPVPILQLEEGRVQTISGVIVGNLHVATKKGLTITTAQVQDETGRIKVVWFNMPFLRNNLRGGAVVILRGRITTKQNYLQMEQPEIFYPSILYDDKVNRMLPVYALTAGLSNQAMSKAVKQALQHAQYKDDFLPKTISEVYELESSRYAIEQIHFPEDLEHYKKARQRLVFEEFFIFIMALQQLKGNHTVQENHFVFHHSAVMEQFMNQLPFGLTSAQCKVWQEILHDLQSERVMSRLVQGDVGSGKTIIAILALLYVVANGYQGALMAPTEVLAKQHYQSIQKMFEQAGLSIGVELLTGSMTAKEKRLAYERIENGNAQLIIGTHALIQDKVQYHNLALVVTDEQHRFGVKQRGKLSEKGNTPHVLVMSATPIPRTLAMIVYGDLDISVIDEMPANRLPIKNCVVDTSYRKTAYEFMRKQVAEGRQCYVVCPMVEDSEMMEAENVIDYAKTLQGELGESVIVSYLHGKMKQSEKDDIMERFANNQIQVLVSTTVIEVGIDVSNATVMMVENAERFGLAQLHQLRGRVGRGSHQSYCIFMMGTKSAAAKERLSVLNHSNDGFYIANEDLKLRGPGDLFGIRQSGLLQFQLGDIYQDASTLTKANEAVKRLLDSDPFLELPENQNLNFYLKHYMQKEMIEQTL